MKSSLNSNVQSKVAAYVDRVTDAFNCEQLSLEEATALGLPPLLNEQAKSAAPLTENEVFQQLVLDRQGLLADIANEVGSGKEKAVYLALSGKVFARLLTKLRQPEPSNTPYIIEQQAPRRVEVEALPFKGDPCIDFAGTGTRDDPYILPAEGSPKSHLQELQRIAVYTRRPFVYAKDAHGLMEVAAHPPKYSSLPDPGSAANPIKVSGQHGAKDVKRIRDEMRNYGLATGRLVTYYEVGTEKHYTTPYAQAGDADEPFRARPGQSLESFTLDLESILDVTDRKIVVGKHPKAEALIVRHVCSGDGTKDSPYQSADGSDLFVACQLSKLSSPPWCFFKTEGGERFLVAFGECWGSYDHLLVAPTRFTTEEVARLVAEFGKPIHQKNLKDAVVVKHLPEGDLGLRPSEGELALLVGPLSQYKAIVQQLPGEPGPREDRFYWYFGNGETKRPFRAFDSDDTSDFLQWVRKVQVHEKRFSVDVLIGESEPQTIRLYDGEGDWDAPFIVPEGVSEIGDFQENLKWIAERENRVVVGRFCDELVVATSLLGTGEAHAPYKNSRLDRSELLEQARIVAMMNGSLSFSFEYQGKVHTEQTFSGRGTHDDPVDFRELPDGLPLGSFRERLQIANDRALVWELGPKGQKICKDVSGTGTISDPFRFPSNFRLYSSRSAAQELSDLFQKPVFSTWQDIHFWNSPDEHHNFQGFKKAIEESAAAHKNVTLHAGGGGYRTPIRTSRTADLLPLLKTEADRTERPIFYKFNEDLLENDQLRVVVPASHHSGGAWTQFPHHDFVIRSDGGVVSKEHQGRGLKLEPLFIHDKYMNELGVSQIKRLLSKIVKATGEDVYFEVPHHRGSLKMEGAQLGSGITYRWSADEKLTVVPER